jgi:hypothetical protein
MGGGDYIVSFQVVMSKLICVRLGLSESAQALTNLHRPLSKGAQTSPETLET